MMREAVHDRRRASDADLLSDDRAHRDLERFPRARHARTWTAREQRAEEFVFAQVPIDRCWIGGQIECSTSADDEVVDFSRL